MTSNDSEETASRRLSLLWSWDENDETQYATPMASAEVEVIDLVSPEVSPHGLKPVAYLPRTLNHRNQQRLLILPMFPSNGEPSLLFTNVAPRQLSIEQAARRCQGHHAVTFFVLRDATAENSFMKQKYDQFFGPLVERLKVDLNILDYNYVRLKQVLQLFVESRLRILNTHRSTMSQWLVKEEEYPDLLEFYLQIDVDLFYMKTCSFRGAQPQPSSEGLFCSQTPACRYTMTACGHCDLCRSTRLPLSIPFNQYERHRFVNGYESILNAPATCSTANIIYALTCPCGQYDYIGESSQTLAQCLRRHREFGHRFIHEFLIGETNRQRAQGIQQSTEMASKSRMRLYQHSIRCSTAMQLFLEWNPQYQCFVPMLKEDVRRQNPYTIGTLVSNNDRSIQQRLNYVPMPPDGYEFSRRQVIKQSEYFINHLDQRPPLPDLNLYNAKIIAVLSLEASDLFRQVIHALFVTHTESKLNTMGHLFNCNTPAFIHNGVWCENLVQSRRH